MERVQFVEHKGVRIVLLDFSGLRPGPELDATLDEAKATIESQPEGSVLLLTDVSGTRFDTEYLSRAKEMSASNRPYVKASAIVGASGLLPVALTAVSRFSGRSLETFATQEEALDWLASQ